MHLVMIELERLEISIPGNNYNRYSIAQKSMER